MNLASQFFTPRNLGLIMVMSGLSMLLSGCQQKDAKQIAVHPVSGSVLSGGMPAAGVQVVLHPVANSSAKAAAIYPNGTTDAEGKFLLTTYVTDDGAPSGAWKVTLRWPDDRLPEAAKLRLLSDGDSLPDRFKGRYADPHRSKLQLTIDDDTTELEPIHLK